MEASFPRLVPYGEVQFSVAMQILPRLGGVQLGKKLKSVKHSAPN